MDIALKVFTTLFTLPLFLIAACNVKQGDGCFPMPPVERGIVIGLVIAEGLVVWAIWR